MSGLARIVLLLGVGVLLGIGCGGSKGKKKPKTPEDDQAMLDGGVGDWPGDGYDQSTGEPPPSGPGVDPPGEHVLSEDARGIYNDAVADARAGRLDQAELGFKRVLQMDGRAHQAAYNLGVLAERRGDDERARSYYRQSIGMQDDYVLAIEAAAMLEVRSGKVNDAVSLLKDKATKYPSNLSLLRCYADTLIHARRYNDAIAVGKQALRIDERNADAMMGIAKANFKLGRYELAETIFTQVLAINPDEAEVFFLRAFIQLEEGNKAAAIEQFELALEKKPDYIEAMNNLATQYILSGNYEPAVELLQRTIDMAPSWGQAHLNHGNALRGAGRWQEARDALRKARQLAPDLKGSLLNLGILYYTADEIDNLERLDRLGEAKRLFAQYKNEKGPTLTDDDIVHKYLREVQLAIEREERRIQQQKERAEREAQREAERAAAEAARAAAGDAGVDAGAAADDSGGEDDDDGWF